jgi:hypothetical protein
MDAAWWSRVTGRLVGGSNHFEAVLQADARIGKLLSSGEMGARDARLATDLLRDIERVVKAREAVAGCISRLTSRTGRPDTDAHRHHNRRCQRSCRGT